MWEVTYSKTNIVVPNQNIFYLSLIQVCLEVVLFLYAVYFSSVFYIFNLLFYHINTRKRTIKEKPAWFPKCVPASLSKAEAHVFKMVEYCLFWSFI
jgi:hypothetical protein